MVKTVIKKIDNKNNILYFEKSNDIYVLCAIELNNRIFALNNINRITATNYAKNKKIINLEKYLVNMLKTKLEEQLRLYVIKNINNYDLYKRNDLVYFTKNLNQPVSYNNFLEGCSIKSDRINQNIIEYIYAGVQYIYNLEHDTIDIIKNGKKLSMLNSYFSNRELDFIIFREQYKRNIAPKIVYELVKIDKFVRRKNSIKIITNNNLICTFKNKLNPIYNLSNILHNNKENYNDFWIDKYYIVTPGLNDEYINLHDVKAFKYGRTILPINHDNLKYEVEYKIIKKVA